MSKALNKWQRRQKLKIKCVQYLGGKCTLCPYDRCIGALDFHHKDPSQKIFKIAKGICGEYSWARLKAELDKCILLCSNCHREQHWETFNDVNLTLISESE
jgi:hypothetical protein